MSLVIFVFLQLGDLRFHGPVLLFELLQPFIKDANVLNQFPFLDHDLLLLLFFVSGEFTLFGRGFDKLLILVHSAPNFLVFEVVNDFRVLLVQVIRLNSHGDDLSVLLGHFVVALLVLDQLIALFDFARILVIRTEGASGVVLLGDHVHTSLPPAAGQMVEGGVFVVALGHCACSQGSVFAAEAAFAALKFGQLLQRITVEILIRRQTRIHVLVHFLPGAKIQTLGVDGDALFLQHHSQREFHSLEPLTGLFALVDAPFALIKHGSGQGADVAAAQADVGLAQLALLGIFNPEVGEPARLGPFALGLDLGDLFGRHRFVFAETLAQFIDVVISGSVILGLFLLLLFFLDFFDQSGHIRMKILRGFGIVGLTLARIRIILILARIRIILILARIRIILVLAWIRIVLILARIRIGDLRH